MVHNSEKENGFIIPKVHISEEDGRLKKKKKVKKIEGK